MKKETSKLWELINGQTLEPFELSQAYARLIEIEDNENDEDWSCWYYEE